MPEIPRPEREPFVGVQLGAHSVFDEGADNCLDLLQETAGVNAVMVYTHTYQGFARGRKPGALANDHGSTPPDPGTRDMTRVWVEHHEERFAGTPLRHVVYGDQEYAGRDVFAELIEPCRRRGIKLYGRVLEGSGAYLAQQIPGWSRILCVDCYGRRVHLPCFRHREYRQWWSSTVEDVFASYPLDGYQWGSERVGPLSNLLFHHRFQPLTPSCFCDHCCGAAERMGINIDRARSGLRSLHETIADAAERDEAPTGGMLVAILRHLLHYPEILAWAMQWRAGRESMAAEIYGIAKTLRPDAQVGLHIDHQASTWDPIHQAEVSYGEMARYADFLKPIVYHDIAGPRIRHWVIERWTQGVLRDFDEHTALAALYAIEGLDPDREPSLEQLPTQGLSADYVYRLTRRMVREVAGRAAVYPGIGMDVPWHDDHFPSPAEGVYEATRQAFAAGADGIVISREYDEIRTENLRAVGRAVAEAVS